MSESSPQTTVQIKLLVSTASEAVSVLQERYGNQARVLSVKQVEADGLKRLLRKPSLEVIVEVPAASSALLAEKSSEAPASSASVESVDTASEVPAKGPVANLYARGSAAASKEYFSDFKESSAASVPAELPEATLGSAANPVRRGTTDAVRRAISMLESVGFDRSLIERVRSEIDFKDIGSLPAMDLYAKICDWLRNSFPDTQADPIGSRRAFIGCCGVGKTAALSKTLSNDVFIKGVSPTVLKIDSEIPNPSDALEIFCEIMDAPLVRSLEEVEAVSEQQPLLVDMPGYSLADARSIETCRDSLDALQIDERILVVNAAYDAELIADMMATGETIGATRVIFTHLDEARRVGKLWKFLLNGRIKPLFFSEGPNPAGDYAFDTYSYLLERSFPNGRNLAAAAGRGRQGESWQVAQEAPASL